MKALLRIHGVAWLLSACVGTAAADSPPFFFDSAFLDENWTLSVESNTGGGAGDGWHNSAGWRTTVNTLNDAAPGVVNTVYVFHRRIGATYDPSTGPIGSIEYIENSRRISGGRQLCGLAIRQNGVVYYGTGFLNPLAFNDWVPTTQPALVPSDFDALAPGLQTPDFSAAGGVMEFGFYRATSTSAGGPGSTTVGGIDGWSVVLDLATGPVATTTSTWGRVKALYR